MHRHSARVPHTGMASTCARLLSRHFPILVVLGAALIAACGGGDGGGGNGPPPAVALQILTQPPTTAANRATLATSTVQLIDASGDPVAEDGVPVTVALNGGGALLGTTVSNTNTDGQASFATLGVGGTIGDRTLQYSAPGLTGVVSSSINLTVGPATNIAASSATPQNGLTSTAVTDPPEVLVTDQDANPVPGVAVTFTVTAGGGTVGGAVNTDVSGHATTTWTLGASDGTNTVTATAAGLTGSPVSFTATAFADGEPIALALVTQPPATNANRATLTTAPVVEVRDFQGDPVLQAGINVTVAIESGGGTLSGTATVATDGAGRATFSTLAIAGTVGNRALRFTAPDLSPVTSNQIALTPGASATLAANSTTTQTGVANTAATTAPSVKVTDADNNPVAGTSVTFAVTVGGGNVTGATMATNAAGIATVGGWTYGAAGPQTVTATSGTLAGSPVSFNATATAVASLFNITLDYLTSATPTQQAAFENAKARWQAVIVGDLNDVNLGSNLNACDDGNLVSGPVDDVLILVTLEPIDGPGQILGSAGPCRIRTSNGLTVVGQMTFDTADLATLESSGNLTDVILHEMGHVLGIGSMWKPPSPFNFLINTCSTANPATTGLAPLHIGSQALAAYRTTNGGGGGAPGVPVENFPGTPVACDNGTRESHWEEEIFRSELMTGFITGTVRPLSLTTIRSLADQGYTVNNAAADPFDINTQPTLRADGTEPPVIDLRGDVRQGPIGVIYDGPPVAPRKR